MGCAVSRRWRDANLINCAARGPNRVARQTDRQTDTHTLACVSVHGALSLSTTPLQSLCIFDTPVNYLRCYIDHIYLVTCYYHYLLTQSLVMNSVEVHYYNL